MSRVLSERGTFGDVRVEQRLPGTLELSRVSRMEYMETSEWKMGHQVGRHSGIGGLRSIR